MGALGVVAAGGLVLLTHDSFEVEVPPAAPTSDEAPAAVAAPTSPDAAPAEGAVTRTDIPAVEAVGSRKATGAARTTGVVRGDIQLAVSALPRLQSMTVAVEEARAPIGRDGTFQPPHRLIVPIEMSEGTPTFEVTGIPFSEYPYVVSVYSPGLNGTRRTVVIDEAHPLVDDIVLAITPGAPFSVLLRDQDAAPYIGLDVRLSPFGEPAGRPRHAGTSDTFGSVVFENVLAGEYQLDVSLGGQPIGEQQKVTVQPGNFAYTTAVQGQGHTVTLPRGTPLQLQVSDVAGYGVAEVRITATATDRPRVKVLEAVTDFGGRAEFPHLLPGVWQIDVIKHDFQRSHRMVSIQAGQPAATEQFRIVRLR